MVVGVADSQVVVQVSDLPKNLVRTFEKELPSDTSQCANLVQTKLDSLGYLDHTVLVLAENGMVRISGKAGSRYLLEKLEFTGNQAFEQDVLYFESNIQEGRPFDAGRIVAGIHRLLDLYQDHGYPFCRIVLHKLTHNQGKAQALVHVYENGQYFIHKIETKGNKHTKPGIIMRELHVGKGDTFSQSALDESVRRLERLGIFANVIEPELLVHARRRLIDVVFGVEEGKSVFAQGVLGYQAGPDSTQNAWTGAVDVDVLNLLGTGRSSRLQFRQEPIYTFFLLSYTEPWVLGYRIHATAMLNMEIEKQSYSKLATSLLSEYYLNYQWALTLRLRHTDISDASSMFLSKTYSGGTGMKWDRLDVQDNPTHGICLQSEVLAHRKRKQNVVYHEWETQTQVELVQRVRNRLVGYVKVGGQNIESPQPVLVKAERIRLGGTRSVRGYREGQFAVQRVLQGTVEVRYLPGRRSRMYIFTDAAYALWRDRLADNTIAHKQATLMGYGMGARIPTRLGQLGIDMAVNRESFLAEVKVHVQLKTAL